MGEITQITIEDEFLLPFCKCGHLKSEHTIFKISLTGTSPCNTLDFNGAVWSVCRCKKFEPYLFQFKFQESELLEKAVI